MSQGAVHGERTERTHEDALDTIAVELGMLGEEFADGGCQKADGPSLNVRWVYGLAGAFRRIKLWPGVAEIARKGTRRMRWDGICRTDSR